MSCLTVPSPSRVDQIGVSLFQIGAERLLPRRPGSTCPRPVPIAYRRSEGDLSARLAALTRLVIICNGDAAILALRQMLSSFCAGASPRKSGNAPEVSRRYATRRGALWALAGKLASSEIECRYGSARVRRPRFV